MVGGPGDIMGTPPSARGFTLKVYETGTGEYSTLYKANEPNGFAFLLYNDGHKNILLKGRGSDHLQDLYNNSDELKNIRADKYSDVKDNMVFLRKICLSGRIWEVVIKNKKYFFVGIWNVTITPNQYKGLKELLSKLPFDRTFIQMGKISEEKNTTNNFTSLSNWTPKISSDTSKKTDLSKKEKEFIQTLHTKAPQLPASYLKALRKLGENAEMSLSDINKIIKYSEEIQSLFKIEDNLEDWVKAKLTHAADYIATVRDYLKFYNDEQNVNLDKNSLDEKWTMKYKKSIDCNNAKGFSQKAHCRARKLRQAGKNTKSRPIKEFYKQAIQELIKEIDSSMAMGSLKQINSDAKELQAMLKPETELEDWVKAKLNLAGEYLDDVYHHLDHFGPEGRKLDEQELEKGPNPTGVGFYEIMMFYSKANDEQREEFDKILAANDTQKAKELIQKVTGLDMSGIKESVMNEGIRELVIAALIAASPMAVAGTYSVKSGDNLSKIASKYNTDVNTLVDLNKLSNPNKIYVGQKLIIPDKSSKKSDVSKKSEKSSSNSLYPGVSNKDIVIATVVDEAGGEGDLGMQAVLNVIMNRGKGNMTKAAEAALKEYQFSGWNDIPRNSNSIDKFIQKKKRHPKYKKAAELVSMAQSGTLRDVTKGADHFLNPVLTKKQNDGKLPSWYTQNRDKVTRVIGKHEFLKLNEFFGFNYYF